MYREKCATLATFNIRHERINTLADRPTDRPSINTLETLHININSTGGLAALVAASFGTIMSSSTGCKSEFFGCIRRLFFFFFRSTTWNTIFDVIVEGQACGLVGRLFGPSLANVYSIMVSVSSCTAHLCTNVDGRRFYCGPGWTKLSSSSSSSSSRRRKRRREAGPRGFLFSRGKILSYFSQTAEAYCYRWQKRHIGSPVR